MKSLYVFAAVVLLLASCKKDKNTTNTPNAADAVLKSLTQSPSGQSTTYWYDSGGRLESLHNSDGSGMTIAYSGDTVIESVMNDSGWVYAFTTYYLNTSGLANNSITTDTFGGVLSYSVYLYDTAGYKTDEKTYDAANNLISHKTWDIGANNVYYYTTTDSGSTLSNMQIAYTYSYEKESTIGNDNMGLKYKGHSSKNIEKTMHKTGTTGNILYSFQYTFDNSGRISTKTAYNHLDELVYTNTYNYN